MLKFFFFSFFLLLSSWSFASGAENGKKMLASFFDLELGSYSYTCDKTDGQRRAFYTHCSRTFFLTKKTTVKEIFETFVPTYNWKKFRETWKGEALHVFVQCTRCHHSNKITKFFVFKNEEDIFLENKELNKFLLEHSSNNNPLRSLKECSFFIPNFNKNSLERDDLSLLSEFFS